MKKYLFIFSMSMVCFNGFAESLYTCDLQKDLMLGSLSIGVFAASFFINGHPTHDSFSRDDVNGFDRILMFPYNENLDAIGSVVMYALLALPVMPMIKNRRDPNALLTYVIMYAEAFLLTHGTKDILKNSISRNRPYAYFGPVPSGLEDDYFKSFPSGHTSLAFMSAGFLTSVFLNDYPSSKWKIPVISMA
jgi:undecaprenyl-diphosphatase